jgi:hypothetical protein
MIGVPMEVGIIRPEGSRRRAAEGEIGGKSIVAGDGCQPVAGRAGRTARPEQKSLARTAQSYIKQHVTARDIAGGDVSVPLAKLGRLGRGRQIRG